MKIFVVCTCVVLLYALPTSGACSNAGGWKYKVGMTSDEYSAEFRKQKDQGNQLRSVSGSASSGTSRYAAVWDTDAGTPQRAEHDLSLEDLQQLVDKHEADGFYLSNVNAHTVKGADVFSGIWLKSATSVAYNLDASQLVTEAKTRAGRRRNQKLISISGYGQGSSTFVAVWARSQDVVNQIVRVDMTLEQFEAATMEFGRQNYQVASLSAYNIGEVDFYAAVWDPVQPDQRAAAFHRWEVNNPQKYKCALDMFIGQGYALRQVVVYKRNGSFRLAGVFQLSGLKSSDLDKVDQAVSKFMIKFKVPQLSFALAQAGRLVFSKAYIRNDQTNSVSATCPATKMRIASVSKPITAAAIYKLVDQGKIKLTDKVFGPGTLLGTTYGFPVGFNPLVFTITVDHLLKHTAGGRQWDNRWGNGDDFNDPMFDEDMLSFDFTQLITTVLATRKLTTQPGTTTAYSNFGYAVLGRVIEKVTGSPYESWVKANILTPCNAAGPQIAGDTLADRKPGEVTYERDGRWDPYTLRVSRMDAHGGWIASAEDIVRFGTCVDNYPTRPDVLSRASSQALTGRGDYAHSGALTSTGTWFQKLAGSEPEEQYVWTILTNQRKDKDGDGYLDEMRDLGDTLAHNTVASWPCVDFTDPGTISLASNTA